jgi:integrase
VLAGLRQSKPLALNGSPRSPRAAHAGRPQIIAVWNAADGRGAFGNIIRLLLLTGARRSEIAKLTRDRILSDRLLLPPTHTKVGEKHAVPLTDLMRTVIACGRLL